MRVIGRIAFLIYAFEISEGVKYTHSLVRYAGRLALLALLSEIPFDFCLFGLHLLQSQQASEGFLESIDWRHQNVFFTLLLGMLAASWMRAEREAIDRRVPPDGTRKSRAVRILLTVGRFAVWAGLINTAQLSAAHPATGDGWEMNAIAATVLGGTSMAGGSGTVVGTVIGAFVIGVINDGMTMCGVSEFWQKVIRGAVIIAAVVIDQAQRNLQARMALQARSGEVK